MNPRLKKHLGQHHLIRPEACDPLIGFLDPGGHRVVEIGPGGGVLTGRLLDAGASVDALEVDTAWAFELARSLRRRGLRVVVADAMQCDLSRLPPATLIAGNLPYQISTALIELLLPLFEIFSRAAFLVQREVAERLLAEPGSGEYGGLSVLTQASTRVSHLGLVRRGAFRPPPKVEGAFVGLEFRTPPLAADEMPRFAGTVRLAFSQRRKMLRNALASGWGRKRAEGVLAEAAISPTARAQELTLADFLRLHQAASPLGPEPLGRPNRS
ncbi:MAG: 16S rRNA (adenine(1518)-N(6)/adenine(1519)-N(6))-dimethyltransferase RsmA [Acidobacteriota bacterium]|nr:16S rRNA (adenine(1518)-N(6)/adenine(1519)-N(6))-dimethyltransferase RsmA [Acidobacteriota bacterium]